MTENEKAEIRRKRWRQKVGKEYLRNYYRNYYKTHPKVKQDNDAWKRRNPDKLKAYTKLRSAHKRKYDKARYASIAHKKRASALKWARENRAHHKMLCGKHRALKKAATVNLRSIQHFYESVKSKKYAYCYWCSRKMLAAKAHFDHIIPLSNGGQHSVENLCVSCAPCNCSKQAKSVWEWYSGAQMLLGL